MPLEAELVSTPARRMMRAHDQLTALNHDDDREDLVEPPRPPPNDIGPPDRHSIPEHKL